MFVAFDKIKELADKQGISINVLEEKLGYGTNTLYRLKRSNPSSKVLKEIADYFNVSADYLLGRTDNPTIAGDSKEYSWQGKTLNVEEMASNVMMFGGRELTDEKKKIIQSIIEGYLKEAGDQRYCLVTEKEIISHFQIRIIDFDGDLMPDELGFYEKETNTAFLSSKLSKKQRVKVLLHELGHKDHTRSEYQNARLRCENEADRNMIHHLVKDAIESLDDPTEFDYLKFMSYYNLKTVTNEIMVKEEYLALVN